MRLVRDLRQRFEDATLQRKIALVMGIGGLLVTAAMGIAAFLLSRQLIIANTQSTQALTAQQVEREIVLKLESAIALAQSLASNTVTANALADSIGRSTYLEPLFSAQSLPFHNAALVLTDYKGGVVAASGSRTSGDMYGRQLVVKHVLERGVPESGLAEQPDSGGVMLLAAFPVIYRLTGQTEGAVILSIPLSALPPGASSKYQVGLRDGEHTLLAGSVGGTKAIRTAIDMNLPAPFQTFPLNLVISQDRAVALRDLDMLIVVFLVVSALLLMAVTVISRAAARFLSLPLSQLASAVRRISETGRPGPVMELQRQDEFGMLARAFQSMLNRLSESYAVLEQRVDERTQALLMSESKLAGILASLVDGVWSLSPDGKRVTYVSPSSAGVTGLEPEVLQNDLGEFFSAVYPDDLIKVQDAMRRLVEHGGSIDLEFRFHNPITGLRVLQARAHTVYDDNHQVVRQDGILTDVTQRSEAESLLRSRELYLRAILDNFPFLVWLKDADSNFLAANSRFAEACGRSTVNEIGGLSDFDVWPAELAELYRADDRAVIAGQVEKNVEEPCEIDGERRWIETFKKPVVNADGQVVGTVGFARDITSRKQMEQQLAASEERWELAISGANDGVWDWDLQSGTLFLSDRWKSMLGYQPEDISNQFSEWETRVHPDDVERVMQEVKHHLDGCSSLFQVEHRVRCKDGRYRWILARGKAVRDADGKATRFLGSHSDIDERVAAETRLRLRTAQLNAIFTLSPDGFVAFGEKDSIEYVSAAFTDLTGLAAHEVIGLSETGLIDRLGALCIADSRGNQLALEALRSLAEDAEPEHGRNLLDITGPVLRTVEVGRRRSSGQNVSKIYYVRDVTHETEVDRMKSEFLSTAAHELRTPMVSILGFSELLLNNDDYDHETVTELVETIHRQSKLMASIINELLDLARIEARRGQDFEIEPLDLNVLIREAVQSFRFPEDNRVPVVHLPAFPAETEGDRRKITQTVLNVLSNAFKYSPLGGEIRIDLQPKSRSGRAGFSVDVRDHGVGMTPESVARVCERFFRADTSGRILGTGLGMSIVKEIIELHGGALDVSSTPGEGTLVSLWLPESASVEKEVAA